MIVCVIFLLVLVTDYKFVSQPVTAAQFHHSTANDVAGKFKRNAEAGCRIPSPLKNGHYRPSHTRCKKPHNTSPACRMIPGTRVPKNWPIWYRCDPGYNLRITDVNSNETVGEKVSYCDGEQWNPTLTVCVESHYSYQLRLEGICGRPSRHLKRTKRNIDGTVSRKGAWPWMVIFGMRKNNSDSGEIHWFCAGTLITTYHILTAAHCVADYRKRNTFIARFNDMDLDDPSDNKGVIEVEIHRNNIIPHPSFKKELVFSHNLAIIKLNSEVAITDFVRPVCLPTPDFTNKPFDNEIAYFTSWGQTDDDREWKRKRRYKPILHELKASIVKHADCNYNYRNYQSDDYVIIGWDLICASVPVNKSCQGDAGSPLMLKVKDKYVLIGVVATPFRCYGEDFPRLFTRLPIYMDWIIPHLKF